MKPLAGRIAIVTGSSAPRGIGRAIALRLAQEGATIVVTDLDGSIEIDGVNCETKPLLAETVAMIELEGGQAIAVPVDVSKQEEIAGCIELVERSFGRLDILVNNAGSLSGASDFLETTPDEWELSFRVNLLGPMIFSRAAIPVMKNIGGGSIINIGSTGSLGAEAGFGAYTSMKHGLIGLTKTIAAEFGVDKIRCNAVCPGYIMTDMHAAANERLAREAQLSVSEVATRRYLRVALRRAGAPEEVADAVAYLAGPHATYVTGIALPVAGGVPFGI
ncbi:SDR family NAD(P)-dependent oxidoreductase [Mesorhizobium captivum]|uniref:SDR family NAD(P)-dependent oxidoreductase n=1 Tax=Mesorhizobium captivum TaxID=3072319 RepID=UPI002A24E5B5|nr:SDR family oxidoreductase [Mesorhizobium sp. VK22E]MDX8507279.1 SDR family oxidoreductase [Mesorhizobium sp. VK22E]